LPGAIFNEEVGLAVLKTGATAIIVSAGPVSQFGPELIYSATYIQGKCYLYAYPATNAVKIILTLLGVHHLNIYLRFYTL